MVPEMTSEIDPNLFYLSNPYGEGLMVTMDDRTVENLAVATKELAKPDEKK